MRGWLGDVLLGFFDFLLDTRSSGGWFFLKIRLLGFVRLKLKLKK